MKNLLLILSLCVIFTSGISQAAETIVFDSPEYATYVANNPSVTISSDYLSIQGTNGIFDSIQRSYVMFDISSLGNVTIESAVFSVSVIEQNNGSQFGLAQDPFGELYYVANDGWDDSIVWPTQTGDLSATNFGSQNMTSGDVAWDELVAGGWDWQVDLSDGLLSLLVAPEYAHRNNFSHFGDPTLTVTYSNVVPAPGSITLAILGLSSVMAIRKKKRNL